MVQKDFEVISLAVECLDQIFEHKLNFKMHINNLGSKDTIRLYNDSLLKFFADHEKSLSEDS